MSGDIAQVAQLMSQMTPEQVAELGRIMAAPSKAIGAGLAMLGAIGAGIGLGIYLGNYVSALGRNPGAKDELSKVLFIGIGLIEAIAIFALAVALINLFV